MLRRGTDNTTGLDLSVLIRDIRMFRDSELMGTDTIPAFIRVDP